MNDVYRIPHDLFRRAHPVGEREQFPEIDFDRVENGTLTEGVSLVVLSLDEIVNFELIC